MVGTALRLLLLFVYVSACAVDGRRGNDVRDGYRGGGNYGDAAGDATGAGNRAWVSAAPRRRVLISSGKEADHPYGIVDEKAAHDEGTGASMLRDAVTAAVAVPTTTALLTETLPDGCEASVCPAEPYRKLGSVCVFGRLHPGAPAFVVPLNPKSSSSTVRTGFKRHGNGLTFEALCRLHDPLPHAVAQRLNVTGWSDIALAVVIREPMSRFVSAWNEITLRATLHVLHTEPPGYTMVRGFMWMRDEVKETLTKRGAINHRRADKSALEVAHHTQLLWEPLLHMKHLLCPWKNIRTSPALFDDLMMTPCSTSVTPCNASVSLVLLLIVVFRFFGPRNTLCVSRSVTFNMWSTSMPPPPGTKTSTSRPRPSSWASAPRSP